MAEATELLEELAAELESRGYVVQLATGAGDNPVCIIEAKKVPDPDADDLVALEIEPEDKLQSIGIEVADFGRDNVERRIDVRWVDLNGGFQSVSDHEITSAALADRIVGSEPEPPAEPSITT